MQIRKLALPFTIVASVLMAAVDRPQGPCDIYATAKTPCVAAHSTTRALYKGYNGPLYQVLRQSDGKTLDISVEAGGYANAAAQDVFCLNTYCWITKIFDQSPKHNDLTQPPRGGFSGPAMGGFNNLPLADMAPATIMGHKVYGVFIEPGMGLRQDDPKGTAVDDQAEGQYWVINGRHYNSGCCFDYGNSEIDSRDDDNGTMETTYFGDTVPWFHGNPPGPWVMTDQENNLVGCVNPDGSKLCKDLPSITWRFVTAMVNGEPHHWTTLGGDAQRGPLSVMFSGGRVNSTYDPMRKQGAILLGNGGDNSNGSQGTFYEGAMTAAKTFPTDETDQLVQANIVAAKYGAAPLGIAPASQLNDAPGLQTFAPGLSQDVTVTFTNATDAPAQNAQLRLTVPNKTWSAVVQGGSEKAKMFASPVAPGESVSATFTVTSGAAASSGDLVGQATWINAASGAKQREIAVEKARNASPIKINEFRLSTAPPANSTNSFIELYNAGPKSVDLSNWMLTVRPAQQAVFSAVHIPAGTKLAAKEFYLLGLANSGLAAAARKSDATVYVRNTTGMSAGDTLAIDTGADLETRKIVAVGTAAANHTTVWQPLPDGPVITIPAGATNLPVTSVAGFAVGQKIALGYGATYPAVGSGMERFEVANDTAVGKAGVQAYLAADAGAGATNIKVTSVESISVGDKIRLDIDSVGHGIENVTVTNVGTRASKTALVADASTGATNIKVHSVKGFATGVKIDVGTPASRQTVTITSIGEAGTAGTGITFTPALTQAHDLGQDVIAPGSGLDLAEPLKFNHAANLPFSDRGTGISFASATKFAHSSNEPVQALGTGVTLDKPLAKEHSVNAAVRDAAVTTAGYQGPPSPNVWFGGPELTTAANLFGRPTTVREGSMVLRDARGVVVDSLNYGGLVDPWAAKGYQGVSGSGKSGCYAPSPGRGGFGPNAASSIANLSAGRYPDGVDTESNCADFLTQGFGTLATHVGIGEANIKMTSTEGFGAGETITIDTGPNAETAVIETVGTPGATSVNSATAAGATVISVASGIGFREGQTVSIDTGANAETAVVASVRRAGGAVITVNTALLRAHAADTQVSGTGITLKSALTKTHADGAQVITETPTPGAPNRYAGR
jgi:hypothetical protein